MEPDVRCRRFCAVVLKGRPGRGSGMRDTMITFLAKIWIKNYERTDLPEVRQSYGVLCGGVGIGFNILLFLGKISPELYLIHGLFIQLFHGQLILLENEMLFILSVLVCSIAAAAVLHIPCGAAVRFLQTAAVPARSALPPGTKKG